MGSKEAFCAEKLLEANKWALHIVYLCSYMHKHDIWKHIDMFVSDSKILPSMKKTTMSLCIMGC